MVLLLKVLRSPGDLFMFSLNSKITKLNVKPVDVITVISSTNRPFVAVAGPPQEANAFIISTKKGKKKSVFICFHIIPEAKLIFYTSDDGPVSEEKRGDTEDEALRLVEEMGFVMIKEELSQYSKAKMDEFVAGLPPFLSDVTSVEKWGESHDKSDTSDAETSQDDDYYEEVMEEIYEEVEVDEEDEVSEEDGEDSEEEYESLDDIVDSIEDDVGVEIGKEGAEGVEGVKGEERVEKEEGVEFDLGSEISQEVESIRETIKTPSGGIEDRQEVKTLDTMGASKETEFFVEEQYIYLVRLLMSL